MTKKNFEKAIFSLLYRLLDFKYYSMGVLLGIIVSLLLFSIIVLLHEYGHYKIAKIFGIQVDEFGLGIPPRAKKLWKNKEGTLFSLNWIPLGGFVKIAGETEDVKLAKAGKNFYEKNIWQKTLVLAAGVIMNFILSFILFFFLFLSGVSPVGINTVIPTDQESKILPTLSGAIEMGVFKKEDGVILSPIDQSIAKTSGLKTGDILMQLNDTVLDSPETMQNIISSHSGKTLIFSGKRYREECIDNNKIICSEMENFSFPIEIPETGKIGTYISENYVVQKDFKIQYGFLDAIKYAGQETYVQIILTLSALKHLFINIAQPETPEDRKEAINQMSGPIGIVTVVTQTLDQGFMFFVVLTALISLNLGVFNLLPIPALDGGRIFILWIRALAESLFGKKKIFSHLENYLHIFFFTLLILLSLFIAYNDILKLS